MRRTAITAGLAVVIAVAMLSGCGKKEEYAEVKEDIADSFPLEAMTLEENPQLVSSNGPYAVIHTTAGDITILLYPEQAPKAVENFVSLAREGYYNGSSFYYVKRDEVAQGGRPAAMDRYVESEAAKKGEPAPEEATERSIWGEPFEDEFDDGLHHFPGAVGMAGAVNGKNQNQSQFYLLSQKNKAEDERVIPANLYMNELIQMRTSELNEKNKEFTMSEEEVQKFEDTLNEEIQAISTDGVPKAYMEKYQPAIDQYKKLGGAWNLDYKYTVFGQIVKGLNIANAMTEVKVDASNRKPKKEILINGIDILDTLEE